MLEPVRRPRHRAADADPQRLAPFVANADQVEVAERHLGAAGRCRARPCPPWLADAVIDTWERSRHACGWRRPGRTCLVLAATGQPQVAARKRVPRKTDPADLTSWPADNMFTSAMRWSSNAGRRRVSVSVAWGVMPIAMRTVVALRSPALWCRVRPDQHPERKHRWQRSG